MASPSSMTVLFRMPLAGPTQWDYLSFDNAQRHLYVSRGDHVDVIDVDKQRKLCQIDGTTKTWALSGFTSPSGLAIDRLHQRLFSVCDNQKMAVTDASDGHQIALIGIGSGPDAVAYDGTSHMIFSSNGESGNITAIHQDDANNYRITATIPTQISAHTLALDDSSHRLYLSAATPDSNAKDSEHRTWVPNSFVVLTVGYSKP